jgi:hypothetical protein
MIEGDMPVKELDEGRHKGKSFLLTYIGSKE